MGILNLECLFELGNDQVCVSKTENLLSLKPLTDFNRLDFGCTATNVSYMLIVKID